MAYVTMKELLEAGLVEKAEAAEAAAEDLEKFIKKKVKLSSLLAQDMARLLDSGFEAFDNLEQPLVARGVFDSIVEQVVDHVGQVQRVAQYFRTLSV